MCRAARPSRPAPASARPTDAGFFCDYAVHYLEQAGFTADQLNTGGYTIKTTLDPNISRIAKQAVEHRVSTRPRTAWPTLRHGQAGHHVARRARPGGQPELRRRRGRTGQTLTNMPTDVSDTFGAGSTFKMITTAAALERAGRAEHRRCTNPSCDTLPVRIATAQPVLPGQQRRRRHNPDRCRCPDALAISPNTAFVGLEIDDRHVRTC